jgi:hypothetical protein
MASPQEKPLLLNIVDRPCPHERDLILGQQREIQSLKQLWARWMGECAETPGADFEDWVEQACRLEAALDIYSDRLDLVFLGKDSHHYYNTLSGQEITYNGTSLRYGSQRREPISMGAELIQPDVSAVDSYHKLASFHRHAERELLLSDGRLLQKLEVLRQRGWNQAVIKYTSPKYGEPVFLDLTQNLRSQFSASGLDWATVYFEAVPDCFLIQERVTMEYETRLMVVQGQVVTSAGCIDANTPLTNESCFDPKVERERGSGLIETLLDLTAEYVVFGNGVAQELVQENSACHSYGLDVCSIGGSPAIVEFNGLLNCGLYASSPREVIGSIRHQQLIL